jgi:hypothetical protein
MAGPKELAPVDDVVAAADAGATRPLSTTVVTPGAPPTNAPDPSPAIPDVKLLLAANSVFGVASAARLGPVGIESCFTGFGEIGASPLGTAVPLTAKTPTATAAVIPVLFLAIVIARFLSQEGVPSNG